MYKCKFCNKVFTKASEINLHICQSQSEIKPEQFPSPPLTPTESLQSLEEKDFQCNYCTESFSFSEQLAQHLKNHLVVSKRTCPFCSKKFSTTSKLNFHIRLHTGSKPCKCPTCGAVFTTVKKRNLHMQKHKCSRYVCSICNESFTHHRALNSHMRIHRREERKNKGAKTLPANEEEVDIATPVYSCRVCLASFEQEVSLNLHMRLHETNKTTTKFICRRCCKSFSNRSNMKKHLKRVNCLKNLQRKYAKPDMPPTIPESLTINFSNSDSKKESQTLLQPGNSSKGLEPKILISYSTVVIV